MSLSKKSIEDAQSLMSMNKGEPKEKPKEFTEEELNRFGDFAGTSDVKEKANYLAKKGLIGASQLISDHPDVSTAKGIKHAQSDWKSSALSLMLMKAKMLGIKTPTQVSANKEALMSSLNDEYKEALNHPAFSQIHPNYWNVFSDLLKDQYDKESKTPIAKEVAIK